MPEGSVYVGRPTQWGNPFQLGGRAHFRRFGMVQFVEIDTAERAVNLFTNWVNLDASYLTVAPPSIAQIRETLAGRDLVCWCPLDQPCHADVLLKIANGEL